MTIYKTGTASEALNDVKFDVHNYYILFGKKIQFVHFDVPICGDEISCPFGPGEFHLLEDHGSIPKLSPSGNYYAKVKATIIHSGKLFLLHLRDFIEIQREKRLGVASFIMKLHDVESSLF